MNKKYSKTEENGMTEEYIEMLIDSIISYDKLYKPPYFILFYLPANEEYDRYDEMYFAVLAAMIEPTKEMIDEVLYETKKQIGNIVYAADYHVLRKDEAINQLEAILD